MPRAKSAPGRMLRMPALVKPGAFEARGMEVPERRTHRNVHRLTRGRGYPWSADLDLWTEQHGAEILPGPFVLVDCDAELLIDGSAGIDGFRWLADAAAQAGGILDPSQCVAVRTPGHRDRGHAPGWHLWFSAPEQPVRFGPLRRCRQVEIKRRGTAPGSPGYAVRYLPGAPLPVLPGWLCDLAGPAPSPHAPVSDASCRGASTRYVRARLEGLLSALLGAQNGERNSMLYWAAARCAGMIADGQLDESTARRVLADAADRLRLDRDEAARTIDSALGGTA